MAVSSKLRMKRCFFSLSIGTLLGLTLACASQIPQTRGVKPRAQVADFDGSKVVFSLVNQPEEKISLTSFMEREGYDFLLLTFGSKACAACNRKAEEIETKVLGKHPLFLTDQGRRFGIVGVNTDPNPERLGAYLKQFSFIRWSDPSGSAMLEFFMDPGEKFRVPLTVMVDRRKILWRVNADETLSVTEIMDKVALSLGGGNEGTSGSQPTPDGPPTGPDGGGVETGSSGITLAHPSRARWQTLTVTDCQGQTQPLSQLLSPGPMPLVLQVTGGRCGALCLEQHKKMTQVCGGDGATACQVWTLVSEESSPSEGLGIDGSGASSTGICESPTVIRGGKPVLETFKSLFDWKTPRRVDSDGYVVVESPVEEPQVFVFDGEGSLVAETLGLWNEEHFRSLASGQWPPHRGIDFPLYRSPLSEVTPGGQTSLSQVREGYELTVLAFFQTDCASCEKEFKEWSAPGGLLEFCANKPGFCQIYGVENRYRPQGWTLDQFYENVMKGYDHPLLGAYPGFKTLGIKVPLLLDPVSDEESTDSFKNRIHDGYLIGKSKELKFLYRKAVFDSEGKLRGIFVSPDDEKAPDPLRVFLERELEVYQTKKGKNLIN